VHSGVVTANDQIDFGLLALPSGGGVNVQYQLWFSKKMQPAGLTLWVQVQPRRSDGGVSSAGPYQSTIVAGGLPAQIQPDPAPTTTPNATASDTPTATASGAGAPPAGQLSPVGGSSSSGGGDALMWLAYTIGALLFLAGIGVIGTLLWRRGPHGVATDWDEPQQYGQPTYQVPPVRGDPPTQIAAFGTPGQGSGHAAQTRVGPAVHGTPGRHAAPTAQFPLPQDPYTDPVPTWIDPD
jgi:hypothetical protein